MKVQLIDLSQRRYLARRLYTASGVYRLNVVSLHDGRLNHGEIAGETPNTVWQSKDVALLRPDALTDFLIDDIEMMLSRRADGDEINAYLSAADLLVDRGHIGVAICF